MNHSRNHSPKYSPKQNHLPPHKRRIVHQGEINRTFLIATVSVVAVVILALLLLFSSNLLGKAIEPTVAGNSLRAAIVDVPGFTNQPSLLRLTFTVTQEINALYFDLVGHPSVSLCAGAVPLIELTPRPEDLRWSFVDAGCDNGMYQFGMVETDPQEFVTPGTVTLTFTLRDLVQKRAAGGYPSGYTLIMRQVHALETSNGDNLFQEGSEQRISFSAAVPPEEEKTVVAESSSGGGGITCTRKWECASWGSCLNNQQSRVCTDVNGCAPTKTVGYRTYPVYLLGPNMPVETQACISPPAPIQPPPTRSAPPLKAPEIAQPASSGMGKLIAEIALALVVIAVLVVILYTHFRGRGGQYNYDELKSWIVQERKMGTSNEDIASILRQHTGWTGQDVKKVAGELNEEEKLEEKLEQK